MKLPPDELERMKVGRARAQQWLNALCEVDAELARDQSLPAAQRCAERRRRLRRRGFDHDPGGSCGDSHLPGDHQLPPLAVRDFSSIRGPAYFYHRLARDLGEEASNLPGVYRHLRTETRLLARQIGPGLSAHLEAELRHCDVHRDPLDAVQRLEGWLMVAKHLEGEGQEPASNAAGEARLLRGQLLKLATLLCQLSPGRVLSVNEAANKLGVAEGTARTYKCRLENEWGIPVLTREDDRPDRMGGYCLDAEGRDLATRYGVTL